MTSPIICWARPIFSTRPATNCWTPAPNISALYAQDAYKVRPDLTINYGLRWDVSQPFYDTQDRIQTFVPGVQSNIYPDSPGALFSRVIRVYRVRWRPRNMIASLRA